LDVAAAETAQVPEEPPLAVVHHPEVRAERGELLTHAEEIDQVAAELEVVAKREQDALDEIQREGIEVSDYSLNYPVEQRRFAARLRAIAHEMRPKTRTSGDGFA
jgi:hypothetical protein